MARAALIAARAMRSYEFSSHSINSSSVILSSSHARFCARARLPHARNSSFVMRPALMRAKRFLYSLRYAMNGLSSRLRFSQVSPAPTSRQVCPLSSNGRLQYSKP